MNFASDNSSAAHPSVMEAVAAANRDYAMPYGKDPIMDRVRARLREVFEAPQAAVYLVATGTAANALALASYCQPFQAVFCHADAHINVDECGAPEFYTTGSKLVLTQGRDAKMTPEGLDAAIRTTGGAVHSVQPGIVSLTNSTENGTVYSAEETRALCDVAKSHGLPVHLDGARFANAVVATGASPAELSRKAGVDVVSFGGTKNGCLGVEAVVFFDPAKAWEFELRRKRGGHLFSKHRYLSAQMEAYLADDLWLDLARAANDAGRTLSDGISQAGGRLLHPTDANAVFAAFPRAAHRRLQDAGAAYYLWPGGQSLEGPDDELLSARMVCSWSTAPEETARFLELLHG
ncbi:low specificity L-threonine aldolase [Mesobaculum littorinae]|uniref:L-threonine aldolase n=1 Tax=Mesobaculum littorinae TaxID=2486419 RepID=A0A438AJY8_9RHOB|nr:low specificity L-threonine aldolase [Mesobaculum littorinae]RVV99123.1 low specificity L-threonine aldolase [Mesobaculum littorinae]